MKNKYGNTVQRYYNYDVDENVNGNSKKFKIKKQTKNTYGISSLGARAHENQL